MWICPILIAVCVVATVGEDNRNRRECVRAAKAILGPSAEIIRYGNFADRRNLEAVAVKRLAHRSAPARILVSELLVMRFERPEWRTVLRVSRSGYITNATGYIGIDYLDDSYDFYGYELTLSGTRSDDTAGFSMLLSYLTEDRQTDGIPIEIAWNPKVGRYQEYEPQGFRAELKNPPRLRRRK